MELAEREQFQENHFHLFMDLSFFRCCCLVDSNLLHFHVIPFRLFRVRATNGRMGSRSVHLQWNKYVYSNPRKRNRADSISSMLIP